jgi:hypothetical protein
VVDRALTASPPITDHPPTVSPTTPASPTTQPSVDPRFIPAEAALQPEDVGLGAIADNDDTFAAGTYSAYPLFDCPAAEKLKITSFGGYLFMRHRNVTIDGTLVWTETFRYTHAHGQAGHDRWSACR